LSVAKLSRYSNARIRMVYVDLLLRKRKLGARILLFFDRNWGQIGDV
jgi:hypothetical protein